jgi:serine/threonine-protein kinase
MSHDPMISALLSDRFRILRNLEKGGVNGLYEAEDIVLRRRMAVKFIYRAYLSTRRAEARFQQEMSLVRALKSQHIAQVFELGVTEDGAPYLVTECLPGEDLRERLARESRLSVARAIEIAVQTLDGLGEAHAHGLLHLNIKPENLFLAVGERGDEVCKIQDFGISKIRVSRFWRHMEAEARSLVYSAPERLVDDGKVDHRADLYSVGAVLYECLSGKPPYQAREEMGLVDQIRSEPPRDLESLRPGLPRGIGLAVDRALAKNPADRYANAREFAEALRPFARGKLRSLAPLAAVAPGSGRGSWRGPAAVLALAVFGVFGYRVLAGDPAPETSAEAAASAVSAESVIPAARSSAPALSERIGAKPLASANPAPPPKPAGSAAASAVAPPVVAPASTEQHEPTLCYLNGDSGNVSTKRPWCKKIKFIKPNMAQKEKFPKWIPAHCDELSVYHCGAAE